MEAIKFDFLKEPWRHQVEAFEKSIQRNNFAFFFEMGTGKTFSTINTLRYLYARSGIVLPTLILCPPIVIKNWAQEIAKYSRIKDSDVIQLSGHGNQRKFLLEKVMKEGLGKIVITNYESLIIKKLAPLFEKWGPTVVVFDESHKLKSPVSKRTKEAIKLADKAQYRYILTGTPILNSPLDIFSQYRVMDLGLTFGKNFFIFRSNFFYDKNAGMPKHLHFQEWVPRPDTYDRINTMIQASSMTVKKADCLDLPPLVKKTVYIDLSLEQRRLYAEMKKDFITYVKDKACVASLAITRAMRLQQIASGFIALEDGEGKVINEKITDNPRAECLKELLGGLPTNAKCLVWSVFRENYKAIRQVCQDLGIDYVEAHGDISTKEKEYAIYRLNNDPSIRVYIGHPQSGGIGANLCGASYSIFYSRSFSLENDLQAEARNYRGGSEIHEKITRIDIIAKDTIDEVVAEKLASKIQIGDKILRDFAKEIQWAGKQKPKTISTGSPPLDA